ncbi:MAG: sigma-70 family RNA polymerase sigma factor [Verrucomicrobiales bacterium]|nr:sigma-70 family RNA polymerase sigma factor [Verrucomicrobiales bacterium]
MTSEDEDLKGESDFPQTRWSMVQKAANPNGPGSFEALSELCEEYWYPLYAFVRSQGAPPEDAADEVQGFFVALLQKDLLESADRNKGKLRSFLIHALKKYRSNEYRSKQTQKRGGGIPHVSIDQEWAEGRFEAEADHGLTPEQMLDRSWARLLLDNVISELMQEFSNQGKISEFRLLSTFLVRKPDDGAYLEVAAKLGISDGNVKVRIHRMRAKYRDLLEHKLRQTLDPEEENALENEKAYLLSTLR